MSDVPILLLIPLFVLVAIMQHVTYKCTWEMLNEWLATNNMTLQSAEQRSFFTGPFFWRTRRGDVVYYFSARDVQSGAVRCGFARCRNGWFSNSIDVIWE